MLSRKKNNMKADKRNKKEKTVIQMIYLVKSIPTPFFRERPVLKEKKSKKSTKISHTVVPKRKLKKWILLVLGFETSFWALEGNLRRTAMQTKKKRKTEEMKHKKTSKRMPYILE